MYVAEQPRKRVCSGRTMAMKRCEDSARLGSSLNYLLPQAACKQLSPVHCLTVVVRLIFTHPYARLPGTVTYTI